MIFNRIPTDRINWVTSSFLIGTFALTLTAVPAYLLTVRAQLVPSDSFRGDVLRHGHEHHAGLPPAVFAHDLQGQVAGEAVHAPLRRGGV